MRRVELTIPEARKPAVKRVLDGTGVGYTASGPLDGPNDVQLVTVTFSAPVNAVEPILDRLWDFGLADDTASVTVTPVESVVSSRVEELRTRFSRSSESGTRIARAELLARARDLTPGLYAYLVLLILSVVIAVAGLVANSAAVVVGSMVVAPLMGPALAASVGTTLGDRGLFERGVVMQVVGVVVAICVATGFAIVVRWIHLLPADGVLTVAEISSRVAPDLLALVVAIAAGAAGAYSLSSGTSTALVGVAVAAALIPPLGVVGIGIAWGMPMVALGAFVLVAVNLVAINLVAVFVFNVLGYRPGRTGNEEAVRSTVRRRLSVLLVSLLVLSSFLGVVTIGEIRASTMEEDVRADVEGVLASPEYADVEVVAIQFIGDDSLPVSQPERVEVIVGHPPDQSHPGLATDLRAAVDPSIVVDLSFEQQE